MSYAIVFSSKTGNTELLADTLHSSNTVIGSFMCQGKMPMSVR